MINQQVIQMNQQINQRIQRLGLKEELTNLRMSYLLNLAVLVLEGHLLAAHDGGELGQVIGDGPVQGDVGEGRLGAPAGGGVDAVDEGLHALLHRVVAQVVVLDEGSQVGVEGGEGLGAGPLVLHDAQEVDHLVAEGGQVLGGGGGDLAGHAAETLLDQLLQAPAGAVAGEHGHVVDVEVAVAVGVGDFVVIDLGQPVVGSDGAGVGEDQAAHGVGDGGVLLDAPVHDLEVLIHHGLVVQHGLGHVAELLPLAAVEDVGLGHVLVAGAAQHSLHGVLDVLHGDLVVLDLALEIGGDLEGQKVDGVVVVVLLLGIEGLFDGGRDLADVKIHDLVIAFYDLIHGWSLLFCISVNLL